HFRGYSDAVPYGSEELLQQQKQASERYKSWKERGLSEVEIDSLFRTDTVEMNIFSWNAADRDTTIKMTPLDSIKYHLSLLQAGFLAAEPQSGKIKAWVGGIDFRHFQYDHVSALRQVGSTFKPVVYATALEKGFDPCERFPNDFITYRPEEWAAPNNGQKYENWSPRNVDGMYGGSYSMRGAVQMSVNSVAAQVIVRKTGIEPVRELAKKMGINSNIPHEPGIALGSVDATLFEMVRMFGAFPNQGKLPTLYGISRIETPDGKVLSEFKAPNPLTFPQVISPTTANVIVRMLRAVIDGGTGGRLRYICNFKYPAGGKTGTTDNNSDGWFMGFTPNLVFGAWVGAGQPMVRWRSTRLGQGGVSALPIAGHFLTKVYNDPDFKAYTENFGEFPRDPNADNMLGCANFIPPDTVAVDSLLADSLQMDSLQDGNIFKKVKDIFNKDQE
ncbi:MAG: penicillin-binding transpeptidase domain-containing protein, partial [Bacteroidota bacterium]